MHTLLVHHDVHAHLASLDVSIRDFIRQKVLWTKTQLAMTGRASRVKGTRGQAWRRSPVRGNQYYLWWAPAEEVGACVTNADTAIAIRDLRHHDNLAPPAPASQSDYQVVHPREIDPRSSLQASVAKGASSSGISATIVRGQPGTGKTLSLLYAARDLVASQRVLYVTYTPQLVEDALLFAKAVGIDDKLVVMTLSALEAAILRESNATPAESANALAQRFESMVRSLDRSVVGPWSNKGQALWAEARASLVGMALPFAWKRGPLTVPPCEILDLAIYRDMSGLDEDAAQRAHHIADIARRRGLLSDQTRARAALDTLMNGDTGDLPVEGVRAVLLDEAQDLTPVEIALLLELPRVIARRNRTASFIAAGDESQTVHPSGFAWGVTKDLIRERLGREPKDIVLGHIMRSPDAILSMINKTGSLYKALPKSFRPSGPVIHNAPPTEDAGRVLQCELPQHGVYGPLIQTLAMSPGRALIILENTPGLDKSVRTASAAVTYTPAEIKGLERRVIVVAGLDETLATLGRLTTRSAHENRSLESLEARYLIDGVRVALSRATDTLVLMRADSNQQIPPVIDLTSNAEAIAWDDLLRLLQEDGLSEEERVDGFLAEAHEHERRDDLRRALECLARAEVIARDLSDTTLLASIRKVRARFEAKSGLRIVVAPTGGDFASLQDAIDHASEGATIQVRPGTYEGPFIITKDIKVVGDGPRGSVVLQGDLGVVIVHKSKVTLEGLSILRRKLEAMPQRDKKVIGRWLAKISKLLGKGQMVEQVTEKLKSDTKNLAVAADNAQLHLRDCEITAEGGPGIFGKAARVHVEGCVVHNVFVGIVAERDCFMTIERTEVNGAFSGIVADDGARLVVRDSVVQDAGENCIFLLPGTEARIENNDLRGAKMFGIFVGTGAIVTVQANRIHKCYGGIKLDGSAGGIFEENDIAESEHVGFWVGSGGDPTVRNNRIRNGGKFGIFMDPKAGGTFEENQVVGNKNSGFWINGECAIVVRSMVIQGNADYSVYIGKGTVGVFEDNEISKTQDSSPALRIDAGTGFTVRRNRVHHNAKHGILCRGVGCVIEDNDIFENRDVGLGVETSGSPQARRNRIHHNAGGIFMRTGASGVYEDNDVHTQTDCCIKLDGANGTFRKNRIRNATRFGVHINGASEPLFEANEISESGTLKFGANVCVCDGANPVLRGNTIRGGSIGVIFYGQAQGVLEGNEISSSSRMGIFVNGGSTPILRGNRIHDTKDHGVVVDFSGGTIEDNEVFKSRGMGIRVDSQDIVVRSNRIHDNMAGGLAVQPQSKGIFERNQIVANTKWGFMAAQESDAIVRENVVQGSDLGIVVCRDARGTYIGNDVRGNKRAGLWLEPGSAPVECTGNLTEGTSGAPAGKPKGLQRGHGKKGGPR